MALQDDRINLDGLRANASPWADRLLFTGNTKIATGNNGEGSIQMDNSGFWEIDYINFTAWAEAVQGTDTAYTELAEGSISTSTANTHFNYAGLTFTLKTQARTIIKNKIRVRHFCGSARLWLPLQQKIIVVPGGELQFTLYNDCGGTIGAEFAPVGRVIPKA